MTLPSPISFFKKLSTPLLVLGLSLLAVRGAAADVVLFPVPPRPADVNPATYPAPRDDWFVKFQGNLEKTRGQQFDLVFDGDSITDFWQTRGKEVWAQHYGSLKAADFGISGDRTENLLWRLQQGQVDGMDPKLVVLLVGTNNIGRESDIETGDQITDGVKAVVAQYLQRCPHAHLLLLGIFPRSAKPTDDIRAQVASVNGKIASLDDGKRVTYLDIGKKFLQPDGTLTTAVMHDLLHPTSRGYEIWANAIQPVVDKYCAAPAPAPSTLAPTQARAPREPVFLTGKEEVWSTFPKRPALGSDVDRSDLETTLSFQKSRTEEQKSEALADKKYTINLVTDAIDPAFETKYPHIYGVLVQADQDAYFITTMIKDENIRLRPYQQHPDEVHPLFETGGYSYPSGHSSGSELQARLIGTLFHADGQDALALKRAQRVRESRVVAGVHYASDVKAGADLGDLIFAALEASPKFKDALAAAAKADNVPAP